MFSYITGKSRNGPTSMKSILLVSVIIYSVHIFWIQQFYFWDLSYSWIHIHGKMTNAKVLYYDIVIVKDGKQP